MSPPNLKVWRLFTQDTVSPYWKTFCVRPWGMMFDSPKLSMVRKLICGPSGNGVLGTKLGLLRPKPARNWLIRLEVNSMVWPTTTLRAFDVTFAPKLGRLLATKVRPGLAAASGFSPYL